MTIEQPGSDFFTAGGTLPPDAPSYIKRPTDDELFRHVMNGDFCYILTPRQMGKSSLMIQIVQRLQKEGIRSAIVDLTVTGTVESEDQWYKGILTQIKRRLRINIDPVDWWEQRKDIPNIQKFVEFLEEVLTEVKERVVIFMDEIDTTLKLDFRDDFFAGIRAIFNDRARNPDLKRLTFVLLGVASPSDLIKDRSRTPFNVGQEIPLRPFGREEARMFETGLEETYPNSGKKILDRVFYWTNGHPYLTQKLCQSVVEARLEKYDDKEVDLLVKNLFTSDEASRETNLQFVRDNVLNYPERSVILSLYKKLLRGVEVRDDKNSLSQNHLKLSGLARAENGRLAVSNRIYSRVFDQRWINKYTEVNWSRRISALLGLIVIALILVLYNDGLRLPRQADNNISCVDEYKDYNGIACLANLIREDPFFLQNEYPYKAKDKFFNTLSWEEQKSLIEIGYLEHHPRPEDFLIVISNLYTSLADIDNSGETTKLLETIQDSLEVEMKDLKDNGLSPQEEDVYNQLDNLNQEIIDWIEARKQVSETKLQDALAGYGKAIERNSQNPATLFERARIYTRLGDYANALKDYDRVIAIVPESSFEPTDVSTSTPNPESTLLTTGIFTTTAFPALTSTPTELKASPPATQLIISSSTPPTELTPATPITFTPTPISASTQTAISTPTTIPTLTPTPLPIQPRFITRGQRIAAVKNDISQNESLLSFYLQVKANDYLNLAANVAILTSTPATGSGIYVRVMDSVTFGLNIRTSTDTSSMANVVASVPAGTQLLLLDASDAAKIGQIDQWVRVREPGGKEGVAPAWYLEKVAGTTPAPPESKGAAMVLVSEGDFVMGSDKGETDEQPVHTVYLDAFYIDKFEVTNGLYKVCVDSGLCEPPRQPYFFPESPNKLYYGNAQYDKYPVIYVDWNMAKTYCEWRGARLPTEAEWEKAARGTEGNTYPWGNDLSCQGANYQGCVNRTSEVGSYPDGVSPYGVYDMAGNVWEWVADWYSDNYYSAASRQNPTGPLTGQSHVIRGGGWSRFDVTTYHRLNFAPTYNTFDIGFRCAADQVQQQAITPGSLATPIGGGGQKIAFVVDNQIWTMNLDGSGKTQLTIPPYYNNRPDWSPDGKRIVFVSGRAGNAEIYVMNADGSAQTRLTFDDLLSDKPAWSPDGRHIAFSNDRQIYVMLADGSDLTALTFNDNSDSPDWSPDGSHIVFESDRDGETINGVLGVPLKTSDIYVMNSDGSAQTRLTFEPKVLDFSPSWSPDGNHIAFVSQRDGNNEIYIMDPDGSDQINLTNNPTTDDDPDWSPDSTMIIYTSRTTGTDDIYIMRTDGTIVSRLTNNDIYDIWPVWQP